MVRSARPAHLLGDLSCDASLLSGLDLLRVRLRLRVRDIRVRVRVYP